MQKALSSKSHMLPTSGCGAGTREVPKTSVSFRTMLYVVMGKTRFLLTIFCIALFASCGGSGGSVKSGVPLTFPRMLDNGNGTVTDTVTGLVWLKQADCIHLQWLGAVAQQTAGHGQCGLTDGSTAGSWRMPNRNEMQSLSDRALGNHADYFNSIYRNADNTIYQAAIFTNFISAQYF